MRRFYSIMARIAPYGTLFALGACGVTDRQLGDFITSTAIRVFVQGLTSVIEAGVVNQGG